MGVSAYGMVRLADGSEKRAEDMQPGDRIWEPVTGAAATVRKVWQGPAVGMFAVELAGGERIDLTGDNRIMTPQGPLAATDLAPGMTVLTLSGPGIVARAEGLAGDFMVYDPVIDGGAWLAVNGVVVGGANS